MMSWSMAQQQYAGAFAGTTSNGLGLGTLDCTGHQDVPGHLLSSSSSHGDINGDGIGLMDGLVGPSALQNSAFGDVDMEMDLSGAQLWDWFNKNQSIMRMLEDT